MSSPIMSVPDQEAHAQAIARLRKEFPQHSNLINFITPQGSVIAPLNNFTAPLTRDNLKALIVLLDKYDIYSQSTETILAKMVHDLAYEDDNEDCIKVSQEFLDLFHTLCHKHGVSPS